MLVFFKTLHNNFLHTKSYYNIILQKENTKYEKNFVACKYAVHLELDKTTEYLMLHKENNNGIIKKEN